MNDLKFKHIFKNLKVLRLASELSQHDLCNKVGLPRSTYILYEKGARLPTLAAVNKLSAFYDIAPGSLLHYDLSQGLIHKIYFDHEEAELISLLNNYEILSITSKNTVMERLDILLERELSFYNNSPRNFEKDKE